MRRGLAASHLAVACAFAAAVLAGAQARAQADPTVNDFALQWARGRYSTPVLCEIEGEPVRGFRRLIVAPGPPQAVPPVARVIFIDLAPGDATRCFTALEASTPNVRGSVHIRVPGPYRPGEGKREFESRLRRERGFDFEIEAGRLRLEEVGEEAKPPREVDFAGGRAGLHLVEEGSDAARLLHEWASPRRVLLELEAPDGTRLRLPLFLSGAR